MIPDPGDAFAVRPRGVVHERLDDEIVAINLDEGTYFAMVGPAADLWSSISPGVSLARIGGQLAGRYGADPGQVLDEVLVFVGDLVDHGLLEQTEADPGAATAALPDSRVPLVWVGPQLERYDDMADLVLLDPIHQVDEAGWPKQPKAT